MCEEDNNTAEELNAIANMIKHAEAQGLLTEVIWSFAYSMSTADPEIAEDKSIPRCCNYALMEWDC